MSKRHLRFVLCACVLAQACVLDWSDSKAPKASDPDDASRGDDDGGPGRDPTDGSPSGPKDPECADQPCGEGERCVVAAGLTVCECEDSLVRNNQGKCAEPVTCPDDAPDADADGFPDACDNCPALSNPEQVDIDGDGSGFACDPVVQLPADFSTAAYRYDGEGSGGTVREMTLALRPDSALLWYDVYSLNAGDSDLDFAVVDARSGAYTRDLEVSSVASPTPFLTQDGTALASLPTGLSGVRAGVAVEPFGPNALEVQGFAFSDHDALQVTTKTGAAFYRYEDGKVTELTTERGRMVARGGPAFVHLDVTDAGKHTLLSYDATTGTVSEAFAGFEQLTILNEAEQGFTYCATRPGSGITVLSVAGALQWSRELTGDANCELARAYLDEQKVRWWSHRPCAGCAASLYQDDKLLAADAAGFFVSPVTYAGGKPYFMANGLAVWDASAGSLKQMSTTVIGSALEYDPPQSSWTVGFTQIDKVVLLQVLPEVREFVLQLDGRPSFAGGVVDAQGGAWVNASLRDEAQLWYFSAPGAQPRRQFESGRVSLTADGPYALVSHEGALYQLGAVGTLEPIVEDANGHSLASLALTGVHQWLGRSDDGTHVLRMQRANGAYTVLTFKAGQVVSAASANPETQAALDAAGWLSFHTSAEDGSAWLMDSADQRLRLLSIIDGVPTLQFDDAYQVLGDNAGVLRTLELDGKRYLFFNAGDRAHAYRLMDGTLDHSVLPAEELAAITWEATDSRLLHMKRSSGESISCSLATIDAWSRDARACVPWGFEGGGFLFAQPVPAYSLSGWTQAFSRAQDLERGVAGAVVVDAQNRHYLVRVPTVLP